MRLFWTRWRARGPFSATRTASRIPACPTISRSSRDGPTTTATAVRRPAFPRPPNLASELLAAHLTFNGYAESLPERGWTGCWAGKHARRHVQWVHFSNVPRELSLPFSDFPQYDRLPTVSFVIPDVDDDMHDGTVKEADEWLAKRLGPLFAWARRNDTWSCWLRDVGLRRSQRHPHHLRRADGQHHQQQQIHR